MSRVGPLISLEATCDGCDHCETERYVRQSDSGCNVYCAEPSAVATSQLGSRRHIGDTTWKTPSWCPLLAGAIAAQIGAKP